MVANLNTYRSTKHSGVEWLGDVPEHWDVWRAKYVLQCIDVRSKTGDEELLSVSSVDGVIPRKSTSVTMFMAESYVGHKLCWPNDLVINSLWAWGRGLGVARHHGIVSTAYGVYRISIRAQVNADYLHTLVRSTPYHWELRVRSKGVWISRLQLTDESFLGSSLPLPPLAEQAAIVRYLDYVDRRVRQVVRAKEKLVGLLDEQKQVIIHRAVTRGLDPDVPLKSSGVEWLGDVPKHWDVWRLRNVAEMRVSNVDKHSIEGEPPVRLCNYVDVYKNDYINDQMDFMKATATPDEIERFRLAKDDVLITKDSETWDDIGVPAMVTNPAIDLISGYHLALLRPCANRIVGGFFLRALQSKGLAYQFHVVAKGVTRYGLSHSGIKSIWIPLPPLVEQTAIVKYLDKATTDIDTTIARTRREIELLREYRTRLIADVVTGKLDVREVAAQLPDETDDPALSGEGGTSTDSGDEAGKLGQ